MNILHLKTSPRGGASFSIQLGDAIVSQIQDKYTDHTLKVHDLAAHPFPHLEEAHLNSFFTPLESRSPDMLEAIKHSDGAIAELNAADVIVIGVPMYNFGIPSTLKSWIDHIARAGVTFKYDENGPQGLVKNKKVYLAVSTGGIYSDGFMKAYDFTENYLRAVLGFLGMTDVTTFRVEGVNMPDVKETALTTAVEKISID